MVSNGRKPSIPKFTSMEKMAEFFDHTDSEELAWEDADVKYVRPDMVHVSIRIPAEDLKVIRRKAVSMGIGYTAAIRMILHQAIAHEPGPGRPVRISGTRHQPGVLRENSYPDPGIRSMIKKRKSKSDQ
ncbi:MAG TPA: CopG family antitoxin [Spirochaetia bacterium]|nr:CopG family antitoxin [Spirochaetia bacterium]